MTEDGALYGDRLLARHAQLAADAILDRCAHLRVVLQELLRVLAALAEPLAAVGEPRAALLDNALFDADVDQVAVARHALAVHDVELRLAERGGDLVLYHLHARAPARDDVAVFDACYA